MSRSMAAELEQLLGVARNAARTHEEQMDWPGMQISGLTI